MSPRPRAGFRFFPSAAVRSSHFELPRANREELDMPYDLLIKNGVVQRTRGIAATVVNGEVLLRDGKHTGALPGQLLRGPAARR